MLNLSRYPENRDFQWDHRKPHDLATVGDSRRLSPDNGLAASFSFTRHTGQMVKMCVESMQSVEDCQSDSRHLFKGFSLGLEPGHSPHPLNCNHEEAAHGCGILLGRQFSRFLRTA